MRNDSFVLQHPLIIIVTVLITFTLIPIYLIYLGQ